MSPENKVQTIMRLALAAW